MNWKFTLFAVLVMVSVSAYAVISECSDGSEAASDDSGSCGHNVTYVFDSSTGTLTISGSGNMDSYDVGDAPWYSYGLDVKKVVISNGVASIGSGAFFGCTSLVFVTIPDSVTYIGQFAFYECTSLISVTIPDSVTSIGESVFYECTSLASITIPDGVTSISSEAFYGCSSLASVTIPDSVTSIGDWAFYECTSLASITIPDSVTSIGSCAFRGCTSLVSVTIPDSVTSIGDWAFYECTGLRELTISISVNAVESNNYPAFRGCTNIEKVTFTPGTGKGYDYGTSYPSYNYYGYTPWYYSRAVLKEVVIEDGVTSIGSVAFAGCTSLVSVTIPNGVTSIGSVAFAGCTSLVSIILPDGVTSIGDDAFYGCSSLTSIILPDSVISIGSGAFFGCTDVSSIRIGPDISSIGDRAFGDIVFYDKDAVSVLLTDADSLKGGCFVKTDDRMVKVDGHMMSFYVDGKVVYRGVFVEGDDDTPIPDVPFRPGYICSWEEFELGTEDVSVNAVYIPKCYHVEFVSEGTVFFAYDLEYGKEITLPSGIPSKDAEIRYVYTFSGWDGYTDGMVLGDDDVTFTAVFDSTVRKYAYTVEYVDGDGNAIADPVCGTADYGSTVYTEIKDIVGYTTSSKTIEVFISEEESKNIARYVYTIIQYDVIYKVDGETVFTDTFDYGTEVTVRETYQMTGHTVTDWSTEDIEVTDGKFTLGASDVVFDAASTVNQYDVIYKVDGETVFTDTFGYGTEVTVRDMFQKTGYTVTRWSTDDAEVSDGKFILGASDVVFDAASTVNQYDVVYKVDGETVFTDTFGYGTEVTVRDIFQKTGYTVTDWSTEDIEVIDGKFTLGASDVAFNAASTVNQYDVIFISDGKEFARYSLAYGSVVVLPDVVPSKDADVRYVYTFSGWDGYTDGMVLGDDDVTFTAVFEGTLRTYSVIFYDYDGSVISSEDIGYGLPITVPEPVRESTAAYDYAFSGWTDTEGNDVDVPGTVLGDMGFHAVYTETLRQYSVSFLVDGVSYAAYVLPYGDRPVLPGAPSKDPDGFYTYAFSGWDGYTEDMTVDGDRVFNALFSRSVIANTGEDGGYEVKADGEGAPFSSETISGIVDGASADPSVTLSVSVGDTLVSFDNEALRNLHGEDADLLVSRLSYGQMTQAVRDVVGHNVAYSISFGSNRSFGNGTVTVTIPYVLAEWKDPNGLFVYYVAEDGTVEEIPCTYSEGYVTFSTDHFSVYAVMYEAVMYEEPSSDGGPSDSMTVFAVIGIVIAVGAVGVGAMMFVKKKRA